MIDLSFLTEEEQEAIMKVLQRDADLKKAEEERVRVLEETVDDTNELKNKTGQWFYEAKSKRHRDKIHGADLIRASIRKKKPQTIAELSQSRTDKAKKSWVNNVNKDIFIPPELFGVMEEPEKEEEEEMRHAQYYRSVPRVDNLSLDETDASFQKAVSSPSKQRRNPFNDAALDDDFLLTSENRLSENGSPRFQQIPGKGIMPPSRKSQSSKTFPKSESKEASQTSSDAVDGSDRHGEQIPKPKVRTVTYKIVDPQSDNDSSFPKPTKRTDSMNGTSARKGILKRSPSSSSTDSEILRISQTFDSQSKSVLPTTPIIEGEAEKNYVDDIPDESSQYSTDRLKQVRFTSADVQDELPLSPDTHKGKEIGEFHLLESDFGKNAMDNIDGFQYLHSEHGSTENGMPVHPETIDLDGDVAVTVSEEEDGDATPYQSLSSSGDHNLIADVLQLEQTPSSSTIRIDSQSSTYELSQEKGSPPAVTTVRPPKEISVNINENGMPASELLIESDSTDLSNPELQPSKLTVDQQPIYATVKSPRVSKLDSSDIQQGKESIDETDPSCKTDTMFTENIRPNHDDERQNLNVLMHTRLLISNTNVQDKKELTNGKSKTGDGKCESAAIVSFHQEVEAEGPKEGKYVAQTWKNEATEHSGEQLLLGKSSASGTKRSYETTENPVVKLQEAHLLIRTEKPMSDLDNRSKLDLECVDSSKKYLKASEQDDVENTKCSEKIQGDYAGSTVGVYNKDVKGHGPSFLEEEDVTPSARVTWKRPQILEQREALPSLETNRLNFRIEKQPEESPENVELSHQSQFIKLPSENASYPEEKVRQHTHNDSLTYKKESETSHRKIREVVQKTVFSPKANNGQSNNGLEEPMKDDFEYANKTVGAGKIPHTLSIKEQQHIIECLGKDTVEIVEKKGVASKAKISEFNIAIQKLHREAEHESSHPNHSKSVSKSSENSFEAEQKQSFETRMQDSIDNPNSSEDEASFTEGEEIVEETIVLPKADLNMSHIVSPLSMDQPMEEQHLSEFPREKAVPHGETEIVKKMIAQPKANLDEFNNRLEKLHKEASVTLSPVNQTGTAVVELQENVSTPEQNLPGCPKEEIIEHVEKTMSPPKDTVSEFNTRLDKMHKESSSPSYHETQEQQSFSESLREKPFQKEISEVTLKTVATPKYDLSEFNINLKKLIVESTLPSPAVQQTLNGVVKMQEKHTIEHQSIFESPNGGSVDNAVALPNTEFRIFNTVVEEPFKTSTSPARHKTPGEKSSFKYPVDESLPQEVNELVVRSDAPQKADRFRDNLEKLSLEASESICPVHQKPRAMGKISVEVSTQEQQNLFGCLREDIVDPAEKTVPKVEFSESNTGLAKLLKESSSPQYHKTPEEKMPFELPRAEVHSIEVRNVDVRYDGPSKVLSNEFKIGLANINEQKSKASFPVFQQATVVMNIKEKHSTQEQLNLVGHLSEEVIETAQNRVVLLKVDVNEFDTGLGAFSTEPSSPSHLGSPGQNCSFEHPTEETPPQEVEEIIERSVALSKSDEFKKCLEKLSMENSLSLSPVHQKTSGVVKIQGDDSTQEEKHFECPREFVETLDKTIAQPKEEHSTFNTRLYKLFEESTSPLQHETLSDQSSFKLPQVQVFPQDATIKSIALPTADLNEGVKNLHKEAPESSLPVLQKASVVIKIQGKDSTQKQKSHDGTPGEEFVEFAGKTVTPQTADLTEHHNGLETPLHHKMPVQKGSLEQHKEEPLKEVEEVVIKAVAPKADLNEFHSSLFKLFTETSLSSSPVHQEASGKATIQEDDFTPQKQSLFEFPEEDTVERTVAPPQSDPKAFRAALNKLEKDALHMSSLPTQSESVKAFNSNASQPEQGNIFKKEIQYSYDSSSCIKMVAVAQKEVVKKATAPPKTDFCEFSDGLEKPLKESAYSSYQTHGQPGSSNPHQKDAPPQDVNEVFVRTVTPSKANLNEFHNSLEKLHMEASVSSPLHQQVGEVVENHEDSTQEEQNHFGCPRKEIVATVEETMLQPNVEHSELNTSFNNQLDKSSSPLHPNVLEEQTSYKLHREKVLDQTVMEVIVKTAVPPNTDLEEFRTGLKKLHKEASTSLPVLQKAAVVNNIQENDSTQKPDGHTREEVVEIAGNTVTQQTTDIREHHVEAPLHHKMLVQKSSLEHRRKEALQDVKEVVLKAVVPQKSDLSDFNSSLKLFTEASLSSSSPVHQEASRKADIQEEDSTHQKQIRFECPKEDIVERTVAPPKSELIAFRAGLKKLQKEAPDMCSLPAQSASVKAFHSNASQPEQKNIFKKEMQHSYNASLGSVNMVAVLRKEGKETVVKETTTPETDFCECSAGLEKPLKESYSSYRETLEQQGSSESPKAEAPPQEVNEVIVRAAAPPKAVLGEFHNALEKLHVESLVSSPVDQQVDEVVNTEEDSTREEENHFGCSRKENATNVKETVARPKVECSELNISLNVQHEESSCVVHQKTSAEQISFKLPTEKVLPQEVITKTAVPPKADLNKFKTVLQKLQKEASQSLPVLQKATVVLKVKEQGSTQTKQSPTGHPIEAVVESAGNTVSLPTANLCEIDTRLEAPLHKQLQEQKRSLEHPREEALLQEVKKVIVKDVTPPKTDLSDYNRLKKKCIETSLSPPAHREARGEAMVKKDSPHQKKSLCELPKEESVERTTAPPKSDLIAFRAGLKKLQKETSDMCSLPTCEPVKAFNKNAYPPEPATFFKNQMKSSLNASSVSLKTDAVLRKEVETVETATTVPQTDFCELSAVLEKPLIESSSYQETLAPHGSSIEPPKEEETPQELKEVFIRAVSPPKASLNEFNNALQKLHGESLVSSPVDKLVGEVAKSQEEDSTQEEQNRFGCPRKEIVATVEMTVAQRNVEHSELKTSFIKQHEGSSFPLLHNTLEEQSCFKLTGEQVLPQEVKEVIVKTAVPPNDDLKEFKVGLQKLHKEASKSLPVLQKAAVVIKIPGKDCTQEQQSLIGGQNKVVVQTVEKAFVPPKAELCEINRDLSKLLEPSLPSGLMLPKQKHSFEHPMGGALLSHVKEVTVKTAALPEAELNKCDHGSGELLKEYSVSSSPVDQKAIGRTEIQDQILLGHPMTETAVTTATPKTLLQKSTTGLVKLHRGATRISSLPSQFESLTHNSEDASQSVQQPILEKMQTCSIASQNFMKMNVVPLKEVIEPVKKTSVPQKNVNEFNTGLEKLLKESSSALHHETMRQQHSSEQPKEDAPSHKVKENIVRTAIPARAGLSKLSYGLENLVMEATEPSHPTHQNANGVVTLKEISSTKKTQHSYKKVMHHRGSCFTDTQREIPKDIDSEAVRKEVSSPIMALSELLTGLKKQNKDVSQASSALKKNPKPLEDIHAVTFEGSPQGVHNVVHASQALGKLYRHTKHPNRESAIAGGHAQSVQSRLAVKSIQLSRNADGHRQEQSPPWVAKETLDKTVSVPKTEIGEFHIGFEKMCMEASTKLVQPADEDVYRHSQLDQVTFDERTLNLSPTGIVSQKDIQLPSEETNIKAVQRKLSTKNIQLNRSFGPQKEKPLPQEVKETVDKTIAVPKTELRAFHIGLEKLYKEASELSLPLHETIDHKEDSHESSSEKDQEGMRRTMHHGQTTSQSEEIVQLPRKDTVKDFSQPAQKRLFAKKIQLSHSYSDGHQQEQRLPQEVREAVARTLLPKMAPSASDVFENICTDTSKISDTLNKTSDNSEASFGNISEQDQERLHKIMHLGQMANTSQEIIQLPNEKKDLREQHSQAVQRRLCTKKFQLNNSASAAYQREACLPQEARETVEKTVPVPKTEAGTFHIGYKMYTEASEASPTLDKSDDKQDMYGIIPVQTQERMNPTISLGQTARTSQNIIQLSNGSTGPKEHTSQLLQRISVKQNYTNDDGLPQNLRGTIDQQAAVEKPELVTFPLGFEKQYWEASEATPTLDGATDNRKDNYGKMSEQDHEGMYRTMHLGQTSTISRELMQLPSREKDPREEHSQRVQRRLSTKKIQLNISASDGYQKKECVPQESGETDETVNVLKTEHREFHVTLETPHKDALETSPTLLETTDNKKEHSEPLERRLSTKKILRCHNIYVHHQQEKSHPQEVIELLKRAVTTKEENMHTADLEKLQQTTQCDSRAAENHAPVSQSEKWLLHQNVASLSLNKLHSTGPIGKEMSKYGNQQKRDAELIENAHVENEAALCKPDERQLMFLHNATHTNVARAIKTFQPVKNSGGEVTLIEDSQAGNSDEISAIENTQDLSASTSFMRETPLVKDKEKTKVKRSSIELRLYSPYEEQNASRRFGFKRSERDINLYAKGWRNSPSGHF